MQSHTSNDVHQARVLDEVKLWAARRYGEQVNAISPAAINITPDQSGDADYIVHLDLSHVPNAPNAVQVKVFFDPDGTICLATGD